MPYRFKQSESIPDGVRRIIAEEASAGAAALGNENESERDESIHEARRSIKKLRGLLKLVRFELGKTYREENAALRGVGRGLSSLRDAGALVETCESLTATAHAGGRSQSYIAVRKGLLRNKRSEESAADVVLLMTQGRDALLALVERLPDWHLKRDDFAALRAGLKASYKRGRLAMEQAAKSGIPEDFHAWRKRAKEHWYHTRLMEPVWTRAFEAREADVHEMEQALGEDHNLTILRAKLLEQPDHYGGGRIVEQFLEELAARQNELRSCAHTLGARIYEAKGRVLVREYETLWTTWREEAAPKESASTAQTKRQSRLTRKKNAA